MHALKKAIQGRADGGLRWGLVLVVLTCAAVAAARHAGAASGTAPSPEVPGPPGDESALVAPQLRRSITLQQQAIAQLYGPQTPETLDVAAQLIMRAYVLVRASHASISRAIARQEGGRNKAHLPSTLLWQERTLAATRENILAAHNGLKDQGPLDGPQIEQRIEHLNAAIAQIQRVLSTVW